MSAQHTQGKWAAVPAADGSGQFGIVADGKFVIAEFFPDIRTPLDRADEECKANATLAATSPELLAELEAARSLLAVVEGQFKGKFQQRIRASITNSRDVIAKATGSAA